jgi:hypothetical protein
MSKSDWINFVKQIQHSQGGSYSDALVTASQMWKGGKTNTRKYPTIIKYEREMKKLGLPVNEDTWDDWSLDNINYTSSKKGIQYANQKQQNIQFEKDMKRLGLPANDSTWTSWTDTNIVY